MIVVTYPALFGPECRAFTTCQRAEQWAHQAGYSGRSTLHDSDAVRLYRVRAYPADCPLFPVVTYRAGHFLNPYHCDQLLKFWCGYSVVPGSGRYEYDAIIDDESVHANAHEIVDHRDSMTILSRPEYVAADRFRVPAVV